jgi:cytochrome c peroxidase
MKKWLLFLLICYNCNCSNKAKHQPDLQQLGRKLFYDNKLSFNQTKACVSCHDPKFAFTDGYKKSIGSEGDMHQRNSKPLFNLAEQHYFTAADSTIHTVLQQMQRPMFNTTPVELGWKNNEALMLQRFNNDITYQKLFTQNFGTKTITIQQLQEAIAAYILSIESYNSNYDKYVSGQQNIFTPNEKQGMQLFFDSLNCDNCHGGKNFDKPIDGNFYVNTGLYNIDGLGAYPITDVGLMQKTNNAADMGKFKIPTLRNLKFTAPYYHDGSTYKLTDVIQDYNNGGRNITNGENKGNGIISKLKHPLIQPLQLTAKQQQNLVSFLLTLTDSTIVHK